MRFFIGLAAVLLASSALAGAARDETVAEYASRPERVRRNYSEYMVGVLRPNHPTLTGSAMLECLEGVARYPENGTLLLQPAVVTCANLIDR